MNQKGFLLMHKLPPKLIAQRIVLIVAVICVVIYLVLKAFGRLSDISIEIGMLLAMVSVLAGDAIVRTWDRSEDQTAISKITGSLERLEEAATKINILVSKPPDRLEEYSALWSGFTGIYRAYNPSYSAEGKPGLAIEQLVQQIFVPRFASGGFEKAHYLFFTADVDGQKDLKEFSKLMKSVQQAYPKLPDKLDVRQIQNSSAKDAEVYLGNRGGTPTAIIKPKGESLTVKRGNPLFYLIVKEGNIYNYLQTHFDDVWNEATPVNDLLDAGGPKIP